MEILLYICGSVALLALAGLFIFLIVFINGTKGLLNSVGTALQGLITEVGALRVSLQGTVKNLEGIVGKMEVTVDRVNSQLDQVEGIVASVKVVSQDVARLATDATDVVHSAKSVAVSVIGFVDQTQQQVQRPINEVMSILTAVSAGIRKFRMKLGGEESASDSGARLTSGDGVATGAARSAPSGIYAE
jgi:uncharacterized protein YoxC